MNDTLSSIYKSDTTFLAIYGDKATPIPLQDIT